MNEKPGRRLESNVGACYGWPFVSPESEYVEILMLDVIDMLEGGAFVR